MAGPADRRRYPRIGASVLYRPAGPGFLHHRRAPVDVSLGGMRAYSDERLAVGDMLELDLLLGDGEPARCWARVAWIERLGAGDGASFDIGLEFTDMGEADRGRFAALLASAGAD